MYSHVEVNKRNSKDQAPLHVAVKKNCIVEVKRLLSLGADVDLTGENGWTPLHVAAYHNRGDSHYDTIKLLLENKADVNALNGMRKTPLHVLTENAEIKTLQLLLEFEADVNKKDVDDKIPLSVAIRSGNKEAVQLLLGYYPDVNKVDGHKRTILHLAAESNRGNSHMETIELLLKSGADVNAQDEYEYTPLHCLAWCANVEVFRLLLDFNADIDVENYIGETPLFEAIRSGNEKIVKLLIDLGSDVNSLKNDGSTPLHAACTYHHELEIIKSLVKKGANLDAVDSEGRTPLFKISKYVVPLSHLKFLFKYADTNCVDNKGINILDKIREKDLSEAALKHFAKLQALELRIHPSILETISKRPRLNKYFKRCTRELTKAKSTKLNNCWVTFYNLLLDSKKKIKNYAGNTDFIEDFLSTNVLKNFPIYGAEINKKVQKGIEMRELFDALTVTLGDYLPIFNPNHLIIRDISNCLQKKDYVQLVWTYKLTNVLKIEDDEDNKEAEMNDNDV